MQANFDHVSGRFNFRHSDIPTTLIQGGIARVSYRLGSGKLQQASFTGRECSIQEGSVSDAHGKDHQQIIRCPANPDGIELIYRINTYNQRPFLLLQLSLCNQSSESIYLHEMCLFQADPSAGGRVQLSEPVGGINFFKVGWHGWAYAGLCQHDGHENRSKLDFLTRLSYSNPVTPRARSRGEFWSEGWGILADAQVAVVAGFVSTAHQFGQVYACTRPVEEALMLVTQMDEIRLDPNESVDSEWGYLQVVPLPNPQPAADYVEAVARQMHARVPASPPLPMWTHWYHFYHNITEQLLLQNLEALSEHRLAVPYQVVELDDGYQSAWGDWTSTNDKFPHGLEWLAEQITAKGFTPGLWLAPFVVHSKSQVARVHPDWLIKNEQGHPINAGFLYNIFVQALDASHPAVLEHLRTLANNLVHNYGYGMLKVDFLYAGALPGKRYNPKLTRAETLRLGLEAIRHGAGEEAFLLGCGCPFGPAIGVVDAMRIGPDTAPSWEPYFNWLPWAGPLIKSEPSMPSLRNVLRHTLNLSSLHKRWWWNDPDCLLVRAMDTHLTEPEVQTAVTLVGLSGGLLVSSDDLRKLDPDRLQWVSKLVPNLGMCGQPLDLLENEMPSIYRVKAEADGREWQLAAVFNWKDDPADCRLRFSELGCSADARLHVFDFWSGEYRQLNDPEILFRQVPAHGCKLLRVCEVGATPQLAGDTLHISMGTELKSMRIVNDLVEIETVDMVRQVEGELWFWLPEPPQSATCNGKKTIIEEKTEMVFALRLSFTGIGRIEVRL